MIIGHRGYLRPEQPKSLENTLLAFEQAHVSGADAVEFDIHLTKDDHLICYHDFTIEEKKIRNMTLADIKSIKLPEEQKIPTFEEIVQLFKDKLYFNIEIKAPEAVYPVLDIIKDHSLVERCVISSFDYTALKVAKGYNTAMLYIKPWGKIEKAKALECKTLHPFYGKVPLRMGFFAKLVLNHHVNLALKYGFAVNPWTVNSAKDALSLARKGVTGIITDDTPLISNVLSSRVLEA